MSKNASIYLLGSQLTIEMGNEFAQLILGVFLGVTSSLIATFLYFRYAYSIKPQLKISDCISKSHTSNGDIKYSVKVVNGTKRSIMNLKIEMFTVKHLDVKGEENDRVYKISESTEIALIKNSLMELKGNKSKEEFSPYEFRFYTHVDLEAFLKAHENQEPHVVVKAFGTDAKTGFGKVFIKKYESINCIKEGPFKAKMSLDVQKI